GDARELPDRGREHDPRAHGTTHARGEVDLALGERGVERRPGGARTVAEARLAHPEVDACGLGLVRAVDLRMVVALAVAPAPRPDGREARLMRDLARGERLP